MPSFVWERESWPVLLIIALAAVAVGAVLNLYRNRSGRR